MDEAKINIESADAAAEQVVENIKRWFHSKTIWVNLAALAIELLNMAEALIPHLEPIAPAWAYHAVALVLPLVNCALRRMTYQAIR